MTDQQLLRNYAERQSETAFAEIVRRHVDLVYSAALRMVCDPHLAQDVTQAAFLDLAQNSRQLTDRPVLSGWLHRTAQNIASKSVRTEVRRRVREQEAVAMNELLAHESDAAWENIAPHLDAALGELSEPDRDALLLRYFERKSAREMALTLNVSEEAAQKRVTRAVERLREFFSKRNVTIGASGLVVLISANAVQAAPIGLIAMISSALSVTAISGVAAKTIIMTTTQKILIATAAAALVGTSVYEAMQISDLHKQVQKLHQQQKPSTDEIAQLRGDRDDAAKRLAMLQEDNERLHRDTAEIIKLRRDAARLQRDSQELAQLKAGNLNDITLVEMKSWLERVKQLKQRFETMADQKIPELEFLTEQDWLDVAKEKRETEYEFRDALSKLRRVAITKFAPMAQEALNKYKEAHEGKFPDDASELQSYFEPPIDSALLQRYHVVPQKTSSDGTIETEWAITQKTTVDGERDARLTVTKDSWAPVIGNRQPVKTVI